MENDDTPDYSGDMRRHFIRLKRDADFLCQPLILDKLPTPQQGDVELRQTYLDMQGAYIQIQEATSVLLQGLLHLIGPAKD